MHRKEFPCKPALTPQEGVFWFGRSVPVYSRATRADTDGGDSFSSAKR
jgi:hypothetical protein